MSYKQLDFSINIAYFADRMVENCPNLICIPRQFEYVGDPSQMRRRPTRTDAKDSPGLQAKFHR